jgi:hypothetical protein
LSSIVYVLPSHKLPLNITSIELDSFRLNQRRNFEIYFSRIFNLDFKCFMLVWYGLCNTDVELYIFVLYNNRYLYIIYNSLYIYIFMTVVLCKLDLFVCIPRLTRQQKCRMYCYLGLANRNSLQFIKEFRKKLLYLAVTVEQFCASPLTFCVNMLYTRVYLLRSVL